MNNTGCGVTGGKMLASLLLECYNRSKAVGHPLALKVFILGRSRQENEGAKALAQVFKLMGSLEEVVMPQNGIYHEGLSALADAFSNNPNLRILNMNDNTFTAKGAKAMASALKKLDKLEVLNLGDCLLKSAGATLICRALSGRHPQLKELILDSNEIREKGGLEIVAAVKDKDNLEKLSIDANQFGEAGLNKIMKKLAEVGKDHIVTETEDNEEPDSDEEDPDVSKDDGDEEDEDQDQDKNEQPKTATSIFGGSLKPGSSLFGGSPKPGSSLFGESPKPGSSLFGSVSSNSLFGGPSASPASTFKPSGNLFGISPSSKNSIFGGSSSTTTSAFGGSSTTTTPVFGGKASESSKDTPKSTGIFTKLDSTADSPKPVFGSSVFGSSSSNVFSNTSKPGGIFGEANKEAADKPDSSSSGPVFGSGKYSLLIG